MIINNNATGTSLTDLVIKKDGIFKIHSSNVECISTRKIPFVQPVISVELGIEEINKLKAETALTALIDQIKTDQIKEMLGLPIDKIDLKKMQDCAAALQSEIDIPSTDKDYKPSEIKV